MERDVSLAASQPSMDRRDRDKRERYRSLSLEKRARVLVQTCRLSMQLLWSRPDARQALRYKTSLPDSSVELWRRLREEFLGRDRDP